MARPHAIMISPAEEPYYFDCVESWPSKDCPYPGLEAILLLKILVSLRLKPVLKVAASFSDAQNCVKNGSADLYGGAIPYSHNLINSSEIEHTPNVLIEPLSFLIRDGYSRALDNGILFSTAHWSIWLASTAVVAFSVAVRSTKLHIPSSKKLYQGYTTSALLVFAVLLGLFSNLVAIGLQRPPQKYSPFTDLADLSQKLVTNRCTLVSLVPENILNEYSFEPSHHISSPHDRNSLLAFKRALSLNPPIKVQISEMVSLIKSTEQCFIGFDWLSLAELFTLQHCGLQTKPIPFSNPREFVLAYRKNWTYGKLFRQAILSGDYDQASMNEVNAYAKTLSICPQKVYPIENPIELRKIGDYFVIWLGLLAFCCATLVYEVIHS